MAWVSTDGFADISGFDNVKARHLASTPPMVSVGSEATPGMGQAAATTKYYFAGGKQIAFRRGADVYYVHSDQLGSAHKISNSGGSVVNSYLYYPWGAARESSVAVAYDYRFNSQRVLTPPRPAHP